MQFTLCGARKAAGERTTKMKFEAVNKIYTQKVAEWIAKGYWINAGTMSGSQGEYAHVDLTNGKDLIRVLMFDECGYGKPDMLVVMVGRCTDKRVRIGITDRLGNTVWNNELEEIEKVVFYKASRGRCGWFYGSREEADAEAKIRKARREARRENGETGVKVFKDAEKIVKPFINRQKGCKSVKLSEIAEVRKVVDRAWSDDSLTVRYEVLVRGKIYRLA